MARELAGDWLALLPPGVRLGLYARSLDKQQALSWQGDERFPAASTIKVPVMMAVHRQVQQRRLAWDERLTVTAAHQGDPESRLDRVPAGERVTIRELVRLMIVVSDNIATNLLLDRIGMAPVNELLAELGCRRTVLQRCMCDVAARARGQENWTTPAEMAQVMAALAETGLRGRKAMLQVLAAQQDREKIPDHLPPGAVLANKPGELPGLRADVALVNGRRGRFVLSIFLDNLPDDQAGDALIGAIASQVYALS